VRVPLTPWQVWWINFSPTEGHEQQGRRPGLVVSSRFHLGVTRQRLLTVLPMTTTERPDWLHRVRIDMPGGRVGWVITEQMRTVADSRLADRKPIYKLDAKQILAVRDVLARMVDL
jgi:mRNA interferase MazF